MRVTDLARVIARRGAERFLVKQGGFVLPLAAGVALPGIVENMVNRHHNTRRQLDQAALQTLYPTGGPKIAAEEWEQDEKLIEALKAREEALKAREEAERRTFGSAFRTQSGFGGAQSGFGKGQKIPPQPSNEPFFGGGTGQSGFGGGSSGFTSGMSAPSAPPSWQQTLLSSLGYGGADAGPISAQMLGGLLPKSMATALNPILAAPGQAIAKHIDRALGPEREFGEKKDIAHQLGTAAIGAFGKGLGTMGADLLSDIANKARAAVGNIGNDRAREAILSQLKREDPVLHDAEDKMLMEAYHTMTRFAPVMSTDKNAVRSFLRQAVMSGSGPDFMTIKLLADSERAVTGEKEKR